VTDSPEGDELGSALAEAAASLESGDLDAALLAMNAAAACTTRGPLTPEVAANARQLFARCQVAEAALRLHLLEALGQAGSSRRAQSAYDR
jgi:hypothetical protein